MRRRPFLLLAACTSYELTACATAPSVDPAAEERAIRALDERWAPVVAKKDTNAALGLYTSDATLMWPDMPAIRGTDRIRAVWAQAVNTPGLTLRVVPEQVRIASAGDLATDEGHLEATVRGPAGVRTDTTKYLHVWRKDGGQWRILYSMTNSNRPTVTNAATK
jgi:uncharacterized protein (TIGR02246 family)